MIGLHSRKKPLVATREMEESGERMEVGEQVQ